MNDAQIKHMVDRFLSWKLPRDTFNPDCGISFDKKPFNVHTAHPMMYEPSGTNLFDAEQAKAMVQYMLEGLPGALDTGASTDFRWLIEAPGARYLAPRKLGKCDFFWTTDHNLALKFTSEEQADLTMGAIRELEPALFAFEAMLGNARPVEHGFG